MASTITLNNTITWAKSYVANLDPSLMVNSEPAMTNANLIKMTMLGPPFTWRFNRVVTGFVSASGVQDYLLTGAGWQASTAYPYGQLIVDSNGNSQQSFNDFVVRTPMISGLTQPVWNTVVGGETVDGGIAWKNLGSFGSGSTSYTFSFIETASVQDITPAKWFEISPNICLALDSTSGRPREISAQKDDNLGNITFRLMPVPDQSYPVSITLQQKTTLFTEVIQTWSPIPDEYSYIYNWGVLALTLLYADHPSWPTANQKFISSLLAAQQGLTETERNIFLNNWQAITGQQTQDAIRLQQGNQLRSV